MVTPSSSFISLVNASCKDSSFSTCPPGIAINPGSLSSLLLLFSTRNFPSRTNIPATVSSIRGRLTDGLFPLLTNEPRAKRLRPLKSLPPSHLLRNNRRDPDRYLRLRVICRGSGFRDRCERYTRMKDLSNGLGED